MGRDLAIVLVTWNVRDLVLDAISSLIADLAGSHLSSDIYVVDNASTDNTVEALRSEFPQIHLTASTENLGFVRANNLALRLIGFGGAAGDGNLPRAVYLLNPDTITQQGATRALFDALFADTRTGMVGARLTYGDGSFQHSAFAFPGLRQLWAELFPTPGRLIEGRFNGRYPRKCYQAAAPFLVDFVLGATMMLRREVVQSVGVFDERFFMYCEEIDWAWRIQEAGWGIRCVPTAHVIHLGGQSTSQARPQAIEQLWRSRLLLFSKHYPLWKMDMARRIVIIGMKRRIAKLRHTEMDDDERKALIEAYQSVLAIAQNIS